MKLTKEQMYAFPTANVIIFNEKVAHSVFYAHLTQQMNLAEIPLNTLFLQYCSAKDAEQGGVPTEWSKVMEDSLVDPLEELGYPIESYNYEVLISFIQDYIVVSLELEDKRYG